MRIISLSNGKVKITPAIYDDVQCLLFEPVPEAHPIGIETGEPPDEVFPEDKDTLIMLGNVKSARVLLEQVQACIDTMEKQAD